MGVPNFKVSTTGEVFHDLGNNVDVAFGFGWQQRTGLGVSEPLLGNDIVRVHRVHLRVESHAFGVPQVADFLLGVIGYFLVKGEN